MLNPTRILSLSYSKYIAQGAMHYEYYSLPSTFCSRPTEIPKIPLRELTHVGVKSAQLNSRCVS